MKSIMLEALMLFINANAGIRVLMQNDKVL